MEVPLYMDINSFKYWTAIYIPDIVFLTGYWYRNINKARKRLEKQVFIALRCIATKHGQQSKSMGK